MCADGPDGDIGRDIAVDVDGNVYTTGFFTGTADFDLGSAGSAFDLSSAGGDDVFVSKLTQRQLTPVSFSFNGKATASPSAFHHQFEWPQRASVIIGRSRSTLGKVALTPSPMLAVKRGIPATGLIAAHRTDSMVGLQIEQQP